MNPPLRHSIQQLLHHAFVFDEMYHVFFPLVVILFHFIFNKIAFVVIMTVYFTIVYASFYTNACWHFCFSFYRRSLLHFLNQTIFCLHRCVELCVCAGDQAHARQDYTNTSNIILFGLRVPFTIGFPLCITCHIIFRITPMKRQTASSTRINAKYLHIIYFTQKLTIKRLIFPIPHVHVDDGVRWLALHFISVANLSRKQNFVRSHGVLLCCIHFDTIIFHIKSLLVVVVPWPGCHFQEHRFYDFSHPLSLSIVVSLSVSVRT